MKITEENLKRGKLTKNNVLKIGNNCYYFKKCKKCKEDYLGTKNSQFCSHKCSTSYTNEIGIIRGGKNKQSFNYVKDFIEKEGYELLSEEYINSHEKIELKCPNSHVYKVRFYCFKQGQRCPKCIRKKLSGKQKLKYNYVKDFIEKEGYELLSEEYVDANSKLKLKCLNNHIFFIRWANFQQGQRCRICSYKNNGEKIKHSYDFIKREFEKEGYKLLSKDYNGQKQKLKIECDKGHLYNISYSRWRDGHRCKKCCDEYKRHSYDFIKREFKKEGYKLLSIKYKNNKEKLKVLCKNNHEYTVNYNNWNNGYRCPVCWNESTSSKAEMEIFDYVNDIINREVISNDRTQIINPLTDNNLELDIWIPYLKKAIEYNGKYWHSFKYQKLKDSIKKEQCKNKGIELLVINEEDWLDNKEKYLDKIKKFVEE